VIQSVSHHSYEAQQATENCGRDDYSDVHRGLPLPALGFVHGDYHMGTALGTATEIGDFRQPDFLGVLRLDCNAWRHLVSAPKPGYTFSAAK
jgi:hypothetical protein